MFLIHKYTNVQGLGFLLGTCTLLRKQHSLDVGQDTALGNGDSSKKLVQLLVIPDSKLQVPWDDTRLLVVPGSIASQLQDLSRQVLHHGCHVHWSTSSKPLGIVALPEQSVDPATGNWRPALLERDLAFPLTLPPLPRPDMVV